MPTTLPPSVPRPRPLFLSEADVLQLVDVAETIDILERAFLGQTDGRATNAPRQRLATEGATLHMMAGAVPGYFGFKTFTTGKGRASARVFLHESAGGGLAAVIEAETLGQIRTGAATGLGTRWLARDEIAVATLFGAGHQAETQLIAIDAVRAIGRVLVVNRDTEKALRFIERMQPRVRPRLEPADSAEDAVRESQLITTITGAGSPVLMGAWLAPGSHINAAGGSALTRREVDAETICRADSIVVDSIEQARRESGELHAALGRGTRHWDEVVELKDVVRARGRKRAPDEISFFKSAGVGLADVALGAVVYERALEKGLGRPLDL